MCVEIGVAIEDWKLVRGNVGRISRKGGWKTGSKRGKMQAMEQEGFVGWRRKGGGEGVYDER